VAAPGPKSSPELTTSFFAFITSFAAGKPVDYKGDPVSN
jgi:hypothetical protein